jgi:hypothetical protein
MDPATNFHQTAIAKKGIEPGNFFIGYGFRDERAGRLE